MSKFDNIKTTATAAIITLENGVPQTEIKKVQIPYTRKLDKAVEYVREVLKLDDSVMIAVQGIEHEKPEHVQYNTGKLVERAFYTTPDFDEAKKMEKDSLGTVKMFTVPVYYASAHIWYKEEGEFYTTKVIYQTLNAYTKANLRGFIKMNFEEDMPEAIVYGIADCKREEVAKNYILVNKDELEFCKRDKREKK